MSLRVDDSTEVSVPLSGMPISSMLLNFLIFWGVGVFAARNSRARGVLKYVIQIPLVLSLIWLVGTAVFYLFTPMFYDHGEAAVSAIGANWLHGAPIYTSMDSPERYSLLYGPLAMMISGWMQMLGSQTIFLSKLPGVLSLLGTIFLLFQIFGRLNLFIWNRIIGVAFFAASMVGMYHFSYWGRPDSYITFFVLLSLYAVIQCNDQNANITTVVVAFLIGLSINAKIHSAIYFVPTIVYFYEVRKMKWSWFGKVMAAAGFIFALVIPFGLSGISFASFLAWISMPLSQGLPIQSIIKNTTYLAAFIIPLWFLNIPQKSPKTFYALCFSSLIIAVVSAKPGSGIQMFMPIFPVIFWLAIKSYSESSTEDKTRCNVFIGAFGLMLVLNGVNRQKQIGYFLKQTPSRIEEFNDLRELTGRISGRMEMGYAGIKEYESTFYKPWLINQGKGLFLDSAAVMETDFTNIPISNATISVLDTCQIPTIIFPKGSSPWSIKSMYTDKPLFSEDFRNSFFNRYKYIESSKFYDVYRCSASIGLDGK